jgi:hypothetical protein
MNNIKSAYRFLMLHSTVIHGPGITPPSGRCGRRRLWRKGCFSTQSEVGSRFVERLLAVSAPCHQHDTHLLSFLTAAGEARWSGQPAPTLVGV